MAGRQRLKRRRRRSRVVVLRGPSTLRALWHRATQGGDARGGLCERSSHNRRRAALREERGGVQYEAQASLSALRRELPPVLCTPALELWLLLQLNSLLRVPYCACTFDPQIRLLGWLPRTRPPLRPGLLRTWFSPLHAAGCALALAAPTTIDSVTAAPITLWPELARRAGLGARAGAAGAMPRTASTSSCCSR